VKVIAAIEADLDESPMGTKSRLSEDVAGLSVLGRTASRLGESASVEQVYVVCPEKQLASCRSLLPSSLDNRVHVRARRIEGAPFRRLVRTARKWSLDGWRGGLGGTCCMDEYTRTDELALLATEHGADALVCASAEGPLIDPAMVDKMVAHLEETEDDSRLTFAQAPPGLVGTVYRRDLLVEMGNRRVPPGMVLSYKPDAPQMDLANKSCCYGAPATVRHANARLIADTDRSLRTIRDFLKSGLPGDAETVGRWLLERSGREVGELPREVELELTTDDQLPDALLRPRGEEVGHRGPMDLKIVECVAKELATLDDSLVVLGGFGEPLLHPEFEDVLRTLSDAGVFGVAVRTNGIAMDAARIEQLIEHHVDVVNVILDAASRETYRRVQGADCFDVVRGNLDVLATARVERRSVGPLLVPEITKSVDTVDELDSFFDAWVREAGWANIGGYSHYAGQCEDRSVINMAPPVRRACQRIGSRMTVLADGRVLLCDQDFTGRFAVGNLAEQSLGACWRGAKMTGARGSHARGCFSAIELCARCDEWHRP